METVLIVLIGVIAVAIIAGLALAPMLNKRGDAAIARAKELAGGAAAVKVIEPKAVGFASDPEDAGGLRGMGCLAASADLLVFVTWAPQKEFVIERASVTGVDTAADDPSAVQKTMIIVTYTDATYGEVKAQFRLARDIDEWLTELGYDWGPDGPPAKASAGEDADAGSTE